MEEQLAKAIVEEARSRGLVNGSGNDLETAEKLIKSARAAYEEGVRGEDVMVFISMAETEAPELAQSGPEEEPEEPPRKSFMDGVVTGSVKAGKKLVRKENLPEPPEIEGDPPILPRDMSKLSDADMLKLLSEFNALRARAIWLISVAEDDLESARTLSNYYEEMAIKKIVDEEGKAGRTASSLKAQAMEDDQVQYYMAKKKEHSSEVRSLKALRDVYDTSCTVISRQWTMRTGERSDES